MPFKIDLGDVQSMMRRAMPAYFVEILRWLFTMVMIFGSILCGILLAAPKLRGNMPFVGRLADNLKPFTGLIGIGTAVCSLTRLFWVPVGTVFVEDMLPGLLGTAAGVIVTLDWIKARQATEGTNPAPTLPEPVAMGLGIAAAVIGFVHMFVGWHAPVL
jgi:hypothetical protein